MRLVWHVIDVDSPHIGEVADLFQRYAKDLNEISGQSLFACDFQTFAAELAGLPGEYAQREQGLLLGAFVDPTVTPERVSSVVQGRRPNSTDGLEMVGVIAWKNITEKTAALAPDTETPERTCEMKRLWVVPAWRGCGIARALATVLIQEAATVGFERMKLDSLDCLQAAIALYRDLGFADCEPYYPNNWPGAVFLDRPLTPDDARSCNVTVRLAEHAATQPDRVALRFPSHPELPVPDCFEELTFGDLEERTNMAAVWAAEHCGVEAGDPVLFLMHPSLDAFVLLLGLIKAGAQLVILDPRMSVTELLRWVWRLAPRVLVAPHILHATFATLARWLLFRTVRTWISTDRSRLCPCPGPWSRHLRFLDECTRELVDAGTYHPRHFAASDAAFAVFTTGSTGPAKPVVITHGMVDAEMTALEAMYAIDPSWSCVEHNMAFVLFDLCAGMTTTILNMRYGTQDHVAAMDPAQVYATIDRYQCTSFHASYRLMANLARFCRHQGVRLPDSVRLALTFGAPIPLDLHQRMRADVLPPHASLGTPYGATECIPMCHMPSALVTDVLAEHVTRGYGVPVGFAVPSLEVRIIALEPGPIPRVEDAVPVPPGTFHTVDAESAAAAHVAGDRDGPGVTQVSRPTVGEIVVAGALVSPTYMADASANAHHKMRDASGRVYHRTGDIGWLDPDALADSHTSPVLWYCGRAAHRLVDPRSGAVYPTVAVESVFNAHPTVFRCALVDAGDPGDPTTFSPTIVLDLEAGAREQWAADPVPFEEELFGELRAMERGCVWSGVVRRFFIYSVEFPVDRRHNSKIDRVALCAWVVRKRHQE